MPSNSGPGLSFFLDDLSSYGGGDGKSMAGLLNEESSAISSEAFNRSFTGAGRAGKAGCGGLRGGAVATSVGARRSSCRDRGAFDEFF